MRARVVDVGRIGRTTAVLSATVALAAWGLVDASTGLSVAAGGVLVIVNLSLIRAIVSRLIARSRRTGQGVGLVILKLAVTVLVAAAMFSGLPIEPVPFSVGVSMLLVSVLLDVCVLGEPVAPN